MILYIHGFASSGKGIKAELLRDFFTENGEKFLSPSLSFIPHLSVSTLENIIEVCDEEITLMGSSLGGYYAIYLAQKYALKAILINPSIFPQQTLQKVMGSNKSFYDESFSFSWDESLVDSLQFYAVDTIDPKLYFLLTQKGDEVLDYTEATKKLSGARIITQEGGNHSFLDIDKYFDQILDFIREEK